MRKIYGFSEETIKQRKKLMLILGLIVIFAMICFTFMFKGIKEINNLQLFKIVISIMTVLILGEMFIVSKIMCKKLKTMEVVITENGMERQGGKYSESIQFKDLTNIQVIKEPSEKIAFIKLKSGNKTINIAGFNDMDDMIVEIQQKKEDSTQFTIKKWKYNWNSPYIALYSGISTIILFITLMNINLNIYEFFNHVVIIGFAIFLLIYRPISKNSGKRFRLLEIILGIVMLVTKGISIIADIIG